MNNLSLMKKRFEFQGGDAQQERMISDKYKSLQKALLYSYQSTLIRDKNDLTFRVLINPNKLKPDYDDKIISSNFENNLKAGDIFEWVGTNTFWLIYSQELTEKAYFRGDIRKCSFELKWKENDIEKKTYAAVRGPVETDISSISKHELSIDIPNHSLHILMPKNEDTLKRFKRYSKFYLSGDSTCWRVEATDSISMPGILEITAEEYYANEIEDDIEAGIVGGKISEQFPEMSDNFIQGPTFIKPGVESQYTVTPNGDNLSWDLKEAPVEICKRDNYGIILKWKPNYSGQFDLFYGDHKKTIVVESLF